MSAQFKPPPQNITDERPEDVLVSEFLPAYNELHQDIWYRLVHVHTSIMILEKIHEHPLNHIYAPQEMIFWGMVYSNFFGLSVVILYTLVQDQAKHDRTPHTLPAFRDKLLTRWLRESYIDYFKNTLANAKFDSGIKYIQGKIDHLRNNLFAHRFVNPDGTLSTRSLPNLPLAQLREYYEAVERLFHACSFGTEYFTTLYPPATVGGKPVKKDIEELLELIVKNSYWLNQPERRAPFWQTQKRYESPEQIEEINKWRTKFGLPPA